MEKQTQKTACRSRYGVVTKAFCCCYLLATMAGPAWGYDRLQPFAGTIELGGQVKFPMTINRQGNFTMMFEMTPQLGFFVDDGWEIILRGKLNQPIVEDEINASGGFGLGFEYLFDGGYVLPYVGTIMDFFWPNDSAMEIHLTTPVGMLIPFNDYVAADVGIDIVFVFPTDDGFKNVTISPGFLGVRCFF
ncbi:MAG: hypothetical protein AAF320_04615 [Myxococcota bacterium]